MSSANRRIEELIFNLMSCMLMRKSKGPSIEPWDTPAFEVDHCEKAPGNDTLCFLLFR